MNTKFITISVFSFVSSSIVQAADVVVPEKPVHVTSSVVISPPFSWAGFYLGGQIGGFSSKISAITPDVDIPLYPDEEAKNKKWVPVEKKYMPELSGFIGGFYAGVNFDLGNNFILGIDTDILLADKKDTKTYNRTEETGDDGPSLSGSGSDDEESVGSQKEEKKAKAIGSGVHGGFRSSLRNQNDAEKESITFTHSLKQKWTGATRVRVGFSAGRVMPYIAGGVAYGQFQDTLSTVITGDEPFNRTSDATKTMIGYTLGGGVDFAMTDNVIVRAEYRYSDFGKRAFKDEIELKYKTNDFRAGIAYRF
ncbi:outer membrane protein [Bartonella acomydis]|uniref:Porin n=1 Tax=Bartonella acomydis TaxID=686234 RepID=A0ABP9MZC6_9HYPH